MDEQAAYDLRIDLVAAILTSCYPAASYPDPNGENWTEDTDTRTIARRWLTWRQMLREQHARERGENDDSDESA